ncbi:nuclear transport factor 2-like isoform X2 [Punica granatum]|uniref:Nuclear transport factor 2-like isoform X2 n=1 Tax=Punica granatum TaxID=22663 RepID=A0A6P8BYI8_PUNGR|nr:nuclear transport factor 2-like isoform X2 [Punica granatum]
MAVQQAPTGIVSPSADVVSKAFVHQYYLILHQSPEHVHRFYQDISKLGRPEENGIMGITTTMKAINEKILSLDYGEFKAEISTVDAQDSYNGGVLVLVTGYLTGKDNVRRKFTQSFFLAPQDKGYFVLNDMFRYVEEPQLLDANPVPVSDVEAPLPVEEDQEVDITEQSPAPVEEEDHAEVYNPSENGDDSVVEVEILAPEVIDESPVDPEVAAESDAKYEDVPKKSYASIVKVMKEGSVQASALTPASVKSATRAQEEQVTASPSPAPTVENQLTNSKVTENENRQESESPDGHSIYLKGLPMNVTYLQVESEFTKFGPIKRGGIQIRAQKGFCFGFVEYEERSAAQSAIEASPIAIGGRQLVVEPKKSTARVNSRERFPSGRLSGVFRNDGPRGRGNYGGGNRGYNRGEMNRPDFGNRNGGRGGYSHHGDGGYHRAERPQRGFNGGDPPKSMAARVPAAA